MMKTVLFSACAFLTWWPAAGHAQAPRSSADPVAQSILASWNGAKTNIVQSGEVMAEDKFAFKPVDGVRTFGQILAHIAGANYVFCSAAKGEKSPHAEDEFEKSATTKAAITKALADSLTYCDTAYSAATDKTLADPVEMPFGMPRSPRSAALIANIGHLNEHYGNLVTYFRINGIVPPSSRR